jgi:hypothetical protein
MEGDIIYVLRKPLVFKSYHVRKNDRSCRLDQLIARTLIYKHYGIEVEDGNVIHFICDSVSCLEEGAVRKTTMEEFLKDGVKTVDTNIKYKFSRERVVKRAYSKLNNKFGGYHWLKNNCEHFAVWCASGTKASRQVKGKVILKYSKKAKDKIASFIAVI